jgi:predicted PurR-regulated permease PerM
MLRPEPVLPSKTDHSQSDRPARISRPSAELASVNVVGSPSQRRALAVSALLSTLALLWLSRPVASGLFLGTLLAFSLLRVQDRLSRRLRSPDLAAVLLALASAIVMIGGLALLTYFVVARGTVAANNVAHAFDPGGTLRNVMTRLQTAATHASPIGPIDLAARIRDAAAAAAAELTRAAAVLAGLTLNAVLTLFFTIMATFFVLRHWTELIAGAERMLPLHPAHTRVVLAEFQKVGSEVFIGTLLTGVAQGVLAGIGYAIAGVPEAALLGALTASCSLVPVVGTLLVWVPIGIVLAISSHVAAGIFVLAWGGLMVVVLCDYVIRPKLVGGKGYVPTLITFIALFGGVEVFGLIGLIVGPVIASVALALLRTYDAALCAAAERERQQAADPTAVTVLQPPAKDADTPP